MSMLKEGISSTVCELTMLILSISVTINVTCLAVTSVITKLYQQCWPIHSCSFYKVPSALACLTYMVVGFTVHVSQLISVCNSVRIITRSPASAGIANRPLVFATRTTLSGHNIEYVCLNLFTLRRFNNNESSGGRQIRFCPY